MDKEARKIVSDNRKAYHEYHIDETYEAGIVLTGTEVKSIRAGKSNLRDSYARVENGEVLLYNMHISPYEQGNRNNVDPLRVRKLLLHKGEIRRLHQAVKEKGLTLVPTKMYLIRGMVKMELGVAKGKKLFDKRDDIAERDVKRETDRIMKERRRESY